MRGAALPLPFSGLKGKVMLRASDLLRPITNGKVLCLEAYREELKNANKMIKSVNDNCHKRYTLHTVPLMKLGLAYYDADDCVTYVRDHLVEQGFYVKRVLPGNVLFISWDPQHIKPEKPRAESKKVESSASPSKPTEHVIEYNPSSAISGLHLRATLMKNNPKYAHLQAKKKRQ